MKNMVIIAKGEGLHINWFIVDQKEQMVVWEKYAL